MSQASDNKAAMLGMITKSPKGIRFDTIMRKTGMSRKQVYVAAANLQTLVGKTHTTDGGYSYTLRTAVPIPAGMPTRRQSIPMHLMQPYTGNIPTHRISL